MLIFALVAQLVVLAQSSKYNKSIHAGVIFATKKFMLKSIARALFYIKLYANQKWSLTVFFNIRIKVCSNMGFCRTAGVLFFHIISSQYFWGICPKWQIVVHFDVEKDQWKCQAFIFEIFLF